MNEKENRVLDTFQNRCLRRILGVRWPEFISNEELYRRSGEGSKAEAEKMAMDWPCVENAAQC